MATSAVTSPVTKSAPAPQTAPAPPVTDQVHATEPRRSRISRKHIPNLFRVALFGPVDPLPPLARRFLITGPSGAGKSTLRAIAGERLRVPRVDIDAFYYGPNRTMRETFEQDVERFTSGPEWAIDWLYSQLRPLLLSRADVLVWLDHNRWTVTQRVVRRTVRRRLRNEPLWNGNVEPPLRTFLTNPDHVIRWSWRTHNQRRKEAFAVADSGDRPFVVRLSGQSVVDAWTNAH